MLSKYEEFKIASIILGKSMKELTDAESSKIREACLDRRKHPDITSSIDGAIEKASQKWDQFYYAEKNVAEAKQ